MGNSRAVKVLLLQIKGSRGTIVVEIDNTLALAVVTTTNITKTPTVISLTNIAIDMIAVVEIEEGIRVTNLRMSCFEKCF